MIGRLLEFMGSHADQVGECYPIIKNSIELPLNQETISQYRASALPPLIARAAEFDRRWTKTFKPAMIRQRNHQRIIADLLRLPQSLKPLQEIRALLLMGLLLSSHEQATFADIESHDSADETENNEQTEDYVVIIYSRVSSNEQSRKGRSVENQEEVLTSIIEGNPTMRTYTDEPIRDEGETGTDFDREGIKRVAKLAQYDEVTHVMIDTIDRLGRDVEQTLRFIRFLRKECDVKLLVRSTEYDFSDPDDKLSFTMRAMVAEFGTMTRARNALQSSAKGFADNKNWSSWYQSIPMGYEQKGNEKNHAGNEEDSSDWIQKVDKFEPVITDIYDAFIEKKNYSEVGRIVTRKHQTMLEESDVEYRNEDHLSGQQIKQVVTNPVYIGRPGIPGLNLGNYNDGTEVEDPELQFISDDTFEQAQKIAEEIHEKYSTEDEQTIEPMDYGKEFGPFVVEAASPIVQLMCPKCEQTLIADGQTTIDQSRAFRKYSCSNDECDFGRRWPEKSERDAMKLLHRTEEFKSLID